MLNTSKADADGIWEVVFSVAHIWVKHKIANEREIAYGNESEKEIRNLYERDLRMIS